MTRVSEAAVWGGRLQRRSCRPFCRDVFRCQLCTGALISPPLHGRALVGQPHWFGNGTSPVWDFSVVVCLKRKEAPKFAGQVKS